MKKRLVILMVAGAMALSLLAGCGHKHTWVEATCTAPKTCSECGETEGAALGHRWVEATCAAPKTCSECGETEGEALEHKWTEANYTQPATCEVCGETDGEPLVPDFEKYGLTINVEEDTTYDYVTGCYDNRSIPTVGHAVFSNYRIVEEDAELGLEKKDGYEWRIVNISVLYDDENFNRYGWTLNTYTANYYDIEGWDRSLRVGEDLEHLYFSANYNGVEYECYHICKVKIGNFIDGKLTCELEICENVPIGYDGVVVGLYNTKNYFNTDDVFINDGLHIYDVADENTLFFRMD